MSADIDATPSIDRTEPSSVAAPLSGPGLRALALELLQQAQTHLARTGEDRHAGVHEARKCVRRVRAALALGATVLNKAKARALDDELGRLCRGLSHLRDGQALIEALRRLRDVAPVAARRMLAEAEALALQRRDGILQRALLRDPEFAARRHRLFVSQKRLRRLDWDALGKKEIAKGLKRSSRRVDKAERRARRRPDDAAAWHGFRRRLRRLRQQDTFLSTSRHELQTKVKGRVDLATALGESQDDVLLLSHCGRRSPFPPEHRTVLAKLASERIAHRRHNPE